MNRAPHIAVVGSANIDLTTLTDDFPRPGETIFGREFHLGFGGKGANQAVAARLCGAEVSMVALVGDDLFGPATIRNFTALGIDCSRVLITPGVSSGVAPIFVDSSGQNRILVAHGIRAILNPAPGQPIDLAEAANADYIIPNETEAEALSGMRVRSLDEARSCAQWLLDRGLRRVIVTLGAGGALCAGPDSPGHVAPFAVDPVDTSGAGDAFIGSFACFLASGCPEAEAIARANLYAALSTLGVGTQKSFVALERFQIEWSARLR